MKNLVIIVIILSSITAPGQLKFETTSDVGRVSSFVYHPVTPNRLFALSYLNHVVVSDDNGATWRIFYGLPKASTILRDLKLAPGSNALSFVAESSLDESIDGLYIIDLTSAEVIKHYIAPNYAFEPTIASYDIFDAGFNNVLLHTRFLPNTTEVYRTSDGGAAWSRIYSSERNNEVSINKVKFHPEIVSTIFMTRGHSPTEVDGGLFTSTDSGVTWNKTLTGEVLGPIAFNPDNSNEIFLGTAMIDFAGVERLYKSSDGGSNWEVIPIDWAPGILDDIVSIHYDPNNTQHIWVLEENEIAISKDGGNTWAKTVYSFDVEVPIYYHGMSMAFDPFDENRVVIESDLYSRFSDDYGATLQLLRTPFFNVTNVDHVKYSSGQHLYYGSMGAYFHKDLSEDVTLNYQVQSPTAYDLVPFTVMGDATNEGRVFIFQKGNMFNMSELFYSDDFGVTVMSIMSDYVADLQKVVKDPVAPNIYWVAIRVNNYSGRLYKVDLNNPLAPAYTEVAVDDEGVIVGISVSASTHDIIVAKGIKIFKSTDDGATWSETVSGLEQLDVSSDLIWDMSVSTFDENKIVVATTNGLFASMDRGAEWDQIFNEFNTYKVAFSPVNRDIIVTARAPLSQLAYSMDLGVTWETVSPTELGNLTVNNIDLSFSTDGAMTAYFATSDLGVASYTINDLILGVSERDLMNVNLYPNPTSGKLVIDSEVLVGEVTRVEIYTLQGVKVADAKLHDNVVDVSNLPRGTYVAKVRTSRSERVVKRFVKY
jgi:xyloglucan-specific exo-beta-1,4-glucanase